jgi:hypothetical protein
MGGKATIELEFALALRERRKAAAHQQQMK